MMPTASKMTMPTDAEKVIRNCRDDGEDDCCGDHLVYPLCLNERKNQRAGRHHPDFVWDLVKSKYASAVFTYRFALVIRERPAD